MTNTIRTPKRIIEEIKTVLETMKDMTEYEKFTLEGCEIMPLLVELGAAVYTKQTGERVL
jgi:hypothetical protein